MRLKIFIGIVLCSLALNLSAQDLAKTVEQAFTKSDAALMQNSLSDEVSLSIVDLKKKVSTEEAISEINKFLKSSPTVSFKMKHTSVRDESAYIIGSLTNQQGKFRVNCFYKKENGKFYIHQIRIDKANE